MILVLYTRILARLNEQEWDRYFQMMPGPVRERIRRYRRWEDRQAGLFGKLLLMEGLRRYGCPSEYLGSLSWDPAGRPFLSVGIDFNIAHSDEYVVCAFCPAGRIGIDIEKVRMIDLADFKKCMTPQEYEEIMVSETRLGKFFNLWTRKEAVLKADGRGLMLSLDQVIFKGEKAVLNGEVWRLKEINISAGYCCHIALNTEVSDIQTESFCFYKTS